MIVTIIVNVKFAMLRVGQREKTNTALTSSQSFDNFKLISNYY